MKQYGPKVALVAMIIALAVGVIDAFAIADLTAYSGMISTILVVGGILVGYLNIKDGESVPFLVASLVIAGGAVALAILPKVGGALTIIFGTISLLVVPAALTVALKVVYDKMKN